MGLHLNNTVTMTHVNTRNRVFNQRGVSSSVYKIIVCKLEQQHVMYFVAHWVGCVLVDSKVVVQQAN